MDKKFQMHSLVPALRLCLCLSLLSLLPSCTDGFEEINTNPNEPEQVTADLLLPTVNFDLANNHVSNVLGFSDIVAQHTARYEFNDFDIYQWTADGRFWGLYGIIQDARDIERFGRETGQPDYEAAAIVLQSYMFSILTDAYGDVPYREAGLGELEGNFTPAYDAQEDIYMGLLDDLDRANTLFVGGQLAGDNLFGGNAMGYRRFGNALRLRLLLRASEVMDVSGELQRMLGDPETFPLLRGNEDNVVYDFTGELPNANAVALPLGRAYDYFLAIPTTHLVELLKEYGDPRIDRWLDPNGYPEYRGVEPGQTLGDIGRPGEYSTKDTSFYEVAGTLDAIFLTFSEQNFLLAEATARNLIDGDAEAYYRAGVEASFAQWGVDMPEDYFDGPAAFSEDNALELIARQKWLSLWQNTTEAWFDWKRTSRPSFIEAGPGNVNGGRVPRRLLYPAIEQSVNPEGYGAAVDRLGGDDINARAWY